MTSNSLTYQNLFKLTACTFNHLANKLGEQSVVCYHGGSQVKRYALTVLLCHCALCTEKETADSVVFSQHQSAMREAKQVVASDRDRQ